jgi:hypothetical protein
LEIVEYFEKNNRIRNKKIDIFLEESYMKKLHEIVKNSLTNIKEKIENTDSELDRIYNKADFERKAALTEINIRIEESILNKKLIFKITYEELEILDNAVQENIDFLKREMTIWGTYLKPEIKEEYEFLLKIQDVYKEELNRILKKLYPKREEVENTLNDYLLESKYNNCLIDNDSVYHIHISMKEKDIVINKLSDILLKIQDGYLSRITANENDEQDIVIEKEEILPVINKILSCLEEEIYNGSVIEVNLKEYYTLQYLIEAKEI